MLEESSPESTTLTWDLEDRLATEFENALIRGEKPSIRETLGQVDPAAYKRLLVELVGIEFIYRRRAGELVDLSSYEGEYPELRALTPAERNQLLGWIADPTTTSPPPDLEQVGRFKILARLAAGGQAETFRALHPGFNSTVVLKIAKHRSTPGMLDRISREGELLKSLPPHENLVRVYDVDFHEGRVFLVLEDVQGTTLEHHARNQPLDVRWAAQTVASLARAVHVAHRRGIIHQDLKPKNVLIDPDGHPRLIDFGVAWYSPWWIDQDDPSQLGGSLNYLSPEQASGCIQQISPATDIFGLGGILFFLLTNSPLYPGREQDGVLQKARDVNFDRTRVEGSEIPPRLRVICLKALEKVPRDRFATALKFAEALERFLAPRRWRHRVVLATLFLLSAGLSWFLMGHSSPERASSVLPREHALLVRVWRPDTHYESISQALPIHTGDELQVRLRVPKGLHVGLCSVNGRGQLSLVQQYPPQQTETEFVYPGPDQTRTLEPPEGTEFLLLCGRREAALSETELKAIWAGDAPWPGLAPAGRILRLQADGVREEGELSRDLGATHDRPGLDSIARRLEALRERLRDGYAFFEGLAFTHEPATDEKIRKGGYSNGPRVSPTGDENR